MYVAFRAGRAGHAAAFSWTITESSSSLGAVTIAATGPVDGGSGNSFARQMILGYWDVGTSPGSITVTADAWATTDIGAYIGVVLFVDPALNAPSAVGFDYQAGDTCAPSLGAATSQATYAIGFGEDDAATQTFDTPDAGWSKVVESGVAYYCAEVLYNPSGDADGATTVAYTGGSPNTVSGMIFELTTSGGSLFTQGVAGSASSSGSLVRQPGKALAGSAAPGGALTRQPGKALAGAAASAGSLLKRTNKSLSGSAGSSGALSSLRLVLIALAGSAASSGALVRSVRKSLVGAASSGGALTRLVGKALSGSAASSGALSSVRTKLVALAGSAASSGVLTRRPARALAGAAASAGLLVKRPSKSLSGASSSSGVVTKTRQVVKALAGAATSVGTLNKRISKGLSGSATPTGGLVKLIGKILSGVASSLSSLASIVSGALTPGPSRNVTVFDDGHTVTQQERMSGTVYDGEHTSTVEES